MFILFILEFIFNSFYYSDAIARVQNPMFPFVLHFTSMVISYPILRDLWHWFNQKKFKVSIFSIYAVFSYSIYVYPLSKFRYLYFYSTRDVGTSLTAALLYVGIFSLLTWLICYYLIRTRYKTGDYFANIFETIEINNQVSVFLNVISALAVATYFFPNINILFKSLELTQMISWFELIASIWIAYLLVFKSGASFIFGIILFSAIIIQVLSTTQIGFALKPLLAFLLMYITKHERIPLLWGTILVGAFSILLSLKGIVRQQLWNRNDPTATYTVSQKADAWKNAFLNFYTEEQKFKSANDYTDADKDYYLSQGVYISPEIDAVNRLAQIAIFTHVMDFTPSVIPNWGWYSYQQIFTKPIPRLLWPNKPIEGVGNYFGHYYSLIFDDDKYTTINLPFIVESYVSFEWMGLFIALIIGLALAQIQKLIVSGSTLLWKLYGVIAYFKMLNMESNLSLIFGDLLLLALFIEIMHRIFPVPQKRQLV